MSYTLSLLSPSSQHFSATSLAQSLHTAWVRVEAGGDADWQQLVLQHADADDIVQIDRLPVATGTEGEAAIQQFLLQIAAAMPLSAAQWLLDYLLQVRTVYRFTLCEGIHEADGWDEMDAFKQALHERAGGIFQSDNEGFSNEAGFHILWQFADDASGPWWMAVRQNGEWQPFQMELSDPEQKEAFLLGQVPAGAEVVQMETSDMKTGNNTNA